jgi:HEAT repeat protein
MRTCSYCGEQVDEAVANCPHCRSYSREVLLRLLRDPAPDVRAQAASDLVFLVPDEEIVGALAVALRDPVVAVRHAAGLELFICGAKAEPATVALVAALDDSDLKVPRLAAASLSMIGPPARGALPKLAGLRTVPDEKLRAWVAEAEARIGTGSAPT